MEYPINQSVIKLEVPWFKEAPRKMKKRTFGSATTAPAAQPRFGMVICQTFLDN